MRTPRICRLAALLAAGFYLHAQSRTVHHYALILNDPAVAERFTAREEAQSAAAESYRGEIRLHQLNLKQALKARKFAVVGSVDTLSNAIFVATTATRADELQSMPGVKGVIEMRTLKPRLNAATQLANAAIAWARVGGQTNAGAGIKVGIIGSGIDQTHPAFQDPSLTMPAGFPKCTDNFPADCSFTSNKVIVARSYIRALSAGSSNDATAVANDSAPDDYSPRDRSGEGTAIASVIAGWPVDGPAVALAGMAPKAWLGNYRVESSPGMPGGGGNFESVYVQALNDAFNDGMQIVNLSAGAVAIFGPLDTGATCGQPSGVPCDFLAYNFEKAAQMGMLITVAAGDDGESGYGFFNNGRTGLNMISSPATAPSVVAVGATLNSHVLVPTVSVAGGPSDLQNIHAQTSDAYSADVAFGAFSGAWGLPLADAANAGDGFACSALPDHSLNHAVALIQQGNCSFNTKATNAANAGAEGIIFYMNSAGAATPVETQNANGDVPLFGPVVMVSQSDGQSLRTYIAAHPGTPVTIDPAGAEMTLSAYSQQTASLYAPGFQPALAANQLLAFSSPGPAAGSLAVKPDIVATGGFDPSNGPTSFAQNAALQDFYFYGPNAFYMATQSFDQSSPMYSANQYIAASGTSFAAPLVAGAAAILMQLHPDFPASQIKAILMNTANRDVFSLGDDWGDAVGAFNAGSGRLDIGSAAGAVVIARAATTDNTNPVSISFGVLTSLPMARQFLITNRGSVPAGLFLTPVLPADASGLGPAQISVTVSPSTMTLAAGATATVTVTLTGKIPAPDEYSGLILIAGASVPMHIFYSFVTPNARPNDMQAIQFGQMVKFAAGTFETVPNGDGGAIAIRLVDAAGVPVSNSQVSFSVAPKGGATMNGVSGHSGCVPASSSIAITCGTDAQGIAWMEVSGGGIAGATPVITATAAGMSIPFTGTIISPPTIAGISESATGSENIAAGSYISIYGTGLSNAGLVGNNTLLGGDAPTFLPYPMNLDGVTVSFDVPGSYDGAPADYNGSPGLFTFVGQAGTQLNVMVPWELQGAQSALVKVTVDGFAHSNIVTIPLVDYAPQLFQRGGIAAAIDVTTYAAHPSPISESNPAHAGDLVELYGNGLGPVNNQPASGAAANLNPPPSTTSPCTVTIGGVDATVSYCGLAGYPAEYQINITVPPGLTAGDQAVVLKVGGASSRSANLPVL